MRESTYPRVVWQLKPISVYDAVITQQAAAANCDIVRRPESIFDVGVAQLRERGDDAVVSNGQLLQRDLQLHTVIEIEH